MKRSVPVLIAYLLLTTAVLSTAGPNEGGTLILHVSIQSYSAGVGYCGAAGLSSCESAVVTAPADPSQTVVMHALAAFPEGASPRLKGVAFGIAYDASRLVLVEHAACPEFVLTTDGWPNSGTGASGVWDNTQSGQLTEVAYFAAYAYSAQDTTSFALQAHPAYGGAFADDAQPPGQDDVAEYGRIGFGTGGKVACPLPGDGPSGEEEPGYEEPNEGGSEESPAEEDPPEGEDPTIPGPSNLVETYILSGALELDFNERNALPIEAVSILDSTLAVAVASTGALTIARANPGYTPADTIGYSVLGDPVRLPDLSPYFRLTYADSASANAAVPVLRLCSVVPYAAVVAEVVAVVDAPNDRFYDRFKWVVSDSQWHLKNNGTRGGDGMNPNCIGRIATAGVDIGHRYTWQFGDPRVTIGIVDNGVLGGNPPLVPHEDLNVIPISDGDRPLINSHPNHDWCTEHGTAMAGLAAARTNNSIGIAGVCADCSILDLESSFCTNSQCTTHHSDCYRISWPHALDHIVDASDNLALPDGKRLDVINMSFSSQWTAFVQGPDLVRLWRVYARDRALVASVGNLNATDPITRLPANVPFVVGVGGHNWFGEFWRSSTSCYNDGQGTSIGYGDFNGRGRLVDICAPASGQMVTAQPMLTPDCTDGDGVDDPCMYYFTAGKTSGAAAIVSGSIGAVQSFSLYRWGTRLPVDDAVGVLLATARRWPSGAHPQSYSGCPTCTREQFGNGRVDLRAALDMVSMRSYWRERVASKNGDIIPGSWRMELAQTETVGDSTYYQYVCSADVIVHSGGGVPPLQEWYCAGWTRRLSPNTNTFAGNATAFGGVFTARQGVRDVRLSVENEEQRATISGYAYAVQYQNGPLMWLVAEDDVRMAYVDIQTPVEVSEDTTADAFRGMELAIMPIASPVDPPVRLGIRGRPGRADVVIISAGGRRILNSEIEVDRYGQGEMLWDGRDLNGLRTAAGVYWLSVRQNGGRAVKRLVVLR